MVFGCGYSCMVILVMMLRVFLLFIQMWVRLQLVEDFLVWVLVLMILFWVVIMVSVRVFFFIVLQCMVLVFEVWVEVMLFSEVLVFGLMGKNRFVFLIFWFSCLWVMLVWMVVVRFLVLMVRIWFICDRFIVMLFCRVSMWFLSEVLVLQGMMGVLYWLQSLMKVVIFLVLWVKIMVFGSMGLQEDLLWLWCLCMVRVVEQCLLKRVLSLLSRVWGMGCFSFWVLIRWFM